jgi:ribonuclease BN (tRNA processing enzyme)
LPKTALTFLGSGDAFNAGGRAHSCYLLEDGDGSSCTVDFGATALMALKRIGKHSAALSSVLLTHLHGDHFAGLPFLLIDGIFREVRGPLTIAGPIGVEDRVRTLSRTCYPDIFTDTLPFELHFIEWQDDVEVTVDGRRVLPVPAIHQDLPERAYSLRITRPGGRRLAFTGDTGWSERLPALLDGARSGTTPTTATWAGPTGRASYRFWLARESPSPTSVRRRSHTAPSWPNSPWPRGSI